MGSREDKESKQQSSVCLHSPPIRRGILAVAYGGDMPGMKQRGTIVTGCTDWFRPVIFKVERL